MEDVLPYRTGGDEIARWVEARARGKGPGQLRAATGLPTKAFEGTVVAVCALGMAHEGSYELTDRGRRYALASEEERAATMRTAMSGVEPYRELLLALSERGVDAPTEVEWIETWWSTRGFGSSQSNRSEGATAFGKLIDFTGAGRYVTGRRGHPSRIEWHTDPGELVGGSGPSGQAAPPRTYPRRRTPERGEPEPSGRGGETAAPDRPGGLRLGEDEWEGYSTVSLEIRPGRTVEIRAPARLRPSEKQRLLTLLDALITEEPDD